MGVPSLTIALEGCVGQIWTAVPAFARRLLAQEHLFGRNLSVLSDRPSRTGPEQKRLKIREEGAPRLATSTHLGAAHGPGLVRGRSLRTRLPVRRVVARARASVRRLRLGESLSERQKPQRHLFQLASPSDAMAELHVVGEIVGAVGFEDRNLFCKVCRVPFLGPSPLAPLPPPLSAARRSNPETLTESTTTPESAVGRGGGKQLGPRGGRGGRSDALRLPPPRASRASCGAIPWTCTTPPSLWLGGPRCGFRCGAWTGTGRRTSPVTASATYPPARGCTRWTS